MFFLVRRRFVFVASWADVNFGSLTLLPFPYSASDRWDVREMRIGPLGLHNKCVLRRL
jgi:hypothetical protein